MVTIIIPDKERLEDQTFLNMLKPSMTGDAVVINKIAANAGIYAVPVSKKLPWMTVGNIPK